MTVWIMINIIIFIKIISSATVFEKKEKVWLTVGFPPKKMVVAHM